MPAGRAALVAAQSTPAGRWHSCAWRLGHTLYHARHSQTRRRPQNPTNATAPAPRLKSSSRGPPCRPPRGARSRRRARRARAAAGRRPHAPAARASTTRRPPRRPAQGVPSVPALVADPQAAWQTGRLSIGSSTALRTRGCPVHRFTRHALPDLLAVLHCKGVCLPRTMGAGVTSPFCGAHTPALAQAMPRINFNTQAETY